MNLKREGTLNDAGNPPNLAACEERVMDPRRLNIELSEELAEIVDALVASGSYADASEVIQEALELFTRQDQPLEEWQERELAASYDEWKANPTGGIPIEEVSARLEEERALRRAKM
jgi:putative addiction module CopG family antidote